MLSSKLLGRYSWDFRAPTFRILDELTGRFWGLDFCFSLGAWEEALWRGKKGSTVGRLCDLLWVALTTYRRFFRRPTVGSFLTLREVALGAGSLPLIFHYYEAPHFTPDRADA